jgi:hypothetical protein
MDPRTFSLYWIGYAGILVEQAVNAHISKKKKPEHRCPKQYRTSQEPTAIFANAL